MRYAGGCTFGPVATGVGPDCDLDERLTGDRVVEEYGNGVESVGGCVYEAR